MMPVLSAPVLAVTLTLKEPLPVRLVGVMFEIVSQLTLLVGTLHVVLDVTLMVKFVATGSVVQEPADRVKAVEVALNTVKLTVNARDATFAPDTVTVAVCVPAARPVRGRTVKLALLPADRLSMVTLCTLAAAVFN